METFRIVSVEEPFTESPETTRRAVRMLFRAGMMDLLPHGANQADLQLTTGLVCALVQNAHDAGIGRSVLAERLDRPRGGQTLAWLDDVDDVVSELLVALDESPYPEGEWGAVRERLGDELLGRLLAISPSSLRRYATGSRPTPDEVAWRLHALSQIVAALIGSYNDYGVRRWFDRPRAQLGGQTPAAVIEAAQSEEDPDLQRVVELAEGLVGAAQTT